VPVAPTATEEPVGGPAKKSDWESRGTATLGGIRAFFWGGFDILCHGESG